MSTNQPGYLIDDGYTQRSTIAAVPGVHAGMTFSFRPAIHEEREALSDAIQRARGGKISEVMHKAVLDHVVAWDAPLELKAEQVRRLRPSLIDKLYSSIIGMRPSDDPADDAHAFDEAADAKN